MCSPEPGRSAVTAVWMARGPQPGCAVSSWETARISGGPGPSPEILTRAGAVNGGLRVCSRRFHLQLPPAPRTLLQAEFLSPGSCG